MPPSSVASRGKLGAAYRQLKFLSPRARKLLSILFAAGLFFFALLSLSIYGKDPAAIIAKRSTHAFGHQRRSLSTVGGDAQHILSESSKGPARAPLKLLLATHNRLLWYHVENDTVQVLHEGEGVHYGVFPGEHDAAGKLKTVWNVIRPHNWRPTTSHEFLVQFDAATGHEVSRVQIHSRFTHDAVRRGDRVYLANTHGGEVQEIAFPNMDLVRSMRLFTEKQHVNTLAPLDDGSVWAVLHNLGKSEAVKIEPNADPRPRVTARVKGVGLKAHGLVAWGPRVAPSFVMLDSDNGALVVINPATEEVHKRWQVPEGQDLHKFLKGLCVVDDVAYFGINKWGSREFRDSVQNDADLAAVDLKTGALLWRRRVASRGLLNIVAAPQLGEQSTYRAMASIGGLAGEEPDELTTGAGSSATPTTAGAGGRGEEQQEEEQGRLQRRHRHRHGRSAVESAGGGAGDGSISSDSGSGDDSSSEEFTSGIDDPNVIAATQKLISLGYKPKTNGKWASGMPRLDLSIKDTKASWKAGIALPLTQVKIDKLKARVMDMPEEMWDEEFQRNTNAYLRGRTNNMKQFKPGVESLYLVFSDQSTEHVYRFPYYDYFKDVIEPLIEQIVGKEDVSKVVRLQFARMKPGSEIKPHEDMGGYARFAHRIHLPVISNSNISFQVCPQMDRARMANRRSMMPQSDRGKCVEIPMEEGMVFELNNRVLHFVLNRGSIKRVQMVVDVAEKPRKPRRLKPGTVCVYKEAVMVCPPEGMLPDY